MASLTVLQIKNQKEPCCLSDGKGLYFEITKKGFKRWLYRYKIKGKPGKFILGAYPDLSLADARTALIEPRALTKEGLNPAQARKKKKEENIRQEQEEKAKRSNSFENVAREWISLQGRRWSPDHAKNVQASLEKDTFPFIGSKPVDEITSPEILKVIRRIESRGALHIAKQISQKMSAVFRYAIQTGRATYNPAADMQGVIITAKEEHQPALFGKELGQLLKDITQAKRLKATMKLVLHFTALTVCRSKTISLAKWEDIDLENKVWNIAIEDMKGKSQAHIVPLSDQALAVLREVEKLWGNEGFVFSSVRDFSKPMPKNEMSKALRKIGYQGKATPHGFRTSLSTMAYESGKFGAEVIEKALAHTERNKVKAAYNRAEYLEQRRELFDWWGDTLQALEYGAESELGA